jgi:hypothetical protein
MHCLFSCQSKPVYETETKEINDSNDTKETKYQDGASSATYTEDDQENIIRLIQLTLKDLFQEDLEKDWIDSLSRQFKYSQIDLNRDGKKEILIGLTGPYFCGSGGCSMILSTHQGDVITQFTVVDYPVYIAKESTNGWQDLILYSGSKNRKVKFDGQSYPKNPSTLEEYTESLENLPKLLDWQSLEAFQF